MKTLKSAAFQLLSDIKNNLDNKKAFERAKVELSVEDANKINVCYVIGAGSRDRTQRLQDLINELFGYVVTVQKGSVTVTFHYDNAEQAIASLRNYTLLGFKTQLTIE
jgi:hypothetical protein